MINTLRGSWWCILFAHQPHPSIEYSRYQTGSYRLTFCERCGQGITHAVGLAEWPVPDGTKTPEEHYREIARWIGPTVADRLSDEIETLVKLRKAEINRLFAKHTAKGTAKNPTVRTAKGGRHSKGL